jgi:hypothetical protein
MVICPAPGNLGVAPAAPDDPAWWPTTNQA